MTGHNAEASRTWAPGFAVDVRLTLKVMRRGAGDPTWLEPGDGTLIKGWQTPCGPVAVQLLAPAAHPGMQLTARAWGPGRQWILDRLPEVLGAQDDPSGFAPLHPVVAQAARRFEAWRVPKTGLVLEALVPSIIEQLVTGVEAFGAYRRLVRRYGAPAPGPWGERGLRVAPQAQEWARIPSWGWLEAGVDARRAETACGAVARAGRVQECADLPLPQARARLLALRGVGRWTVAEVAHVALGDADAVSFGDYHVAADMGWALTGRPVDDDQLEVLLRPYAPHRYRVQRLLELAGHRRPRRGPRATIRSHTPTRR
ncbi:DNA-3-methyladenine glycosylase family protein [Gephyromycinifex aptenodytis]|uniref:DNA-3-methyladenine glycosylase family protein n=1 Tax=Gephyromycinifex aptenodytis TaxID=2716227 RepID=UPI00144508DD|nr:DNA-3-methyladenine glycosylase 2 family protein [Gephyromycinifex aptenodytis]